MPSHPSFQSNLSRALLVLISATCSLDAGAAAGRIDFATAGATIAGRDGLQRPLAKGAELDSGDTIRTDAGARAQIRFSDGSYVSLQPNTEFAVKDYNFDGRTDGSERGFFGLAKGAMRTVTGLIGRVNRDRYQLATPTATVGIRGTGGRIEVLLDGSTLIAGTSGIWTLTNPSGTLDVPAGTFGRAPSAPNQPPRQSSQGPNTGPAPLPLNPPKAQEPRGVDAKMDPSCQTNPTAAACLGSFTTIRPLVSGDGYTASVGFSTSPGSTVLQSYPGATAAFDSAGRLTAVNQSTQIFKLDPVAGSHADFGTDGILAWGRWTGQVTGTHDGSPFSETYDANRGLHYVVGTPTPMLPVSGTATYTLLGATRPTYSDGHSAPGTFSASLNVAFTPSGATVGMNLNVSMSDGKAYAIGGTTLVSSSSQFAGSALNSSGSQSGPLTIVSTAGGGCGSTCSADVQGFFAGASAQRAGLGYRIQDGAQITGAAAFTK